MSTAKEKMRARIAAMTTPQIVSAYRDAAQRFEANPQGPDSNELIIVMGFLDFEILERDIPACLECAVPTAANWHATSMHDDKDTPAGKLADALADAAMAAATKATDGKCPVCVYGEPTDHTCDEGQQHRYRIEHAGARGER